MAVSWEQRCIAYSMLLSGSSAQITAKHFNVNTGAVVDWAMSRPGMSGDWIPWKDQSHGTSQ